MVRPIAFVPLCLIALRVSTPVWKVSVMIGRNIVLMPLLEEAGSLSPEADWLTNSRVALFSTHVDLA
jgi:hypothetical protein